jgi:hypothetical protein
MGARSVILEHLYTSKPCDQTPTLAHPHNMLLPLFILLSIKVYPHLFCEYWFPLRSTGILS